MKATRNYEGTVVARARRDSRFRVGLLMNAVEALQANELQVSKDMLRKYIEASGSLKVLAAKNHTSEKRLNRMLGPGSDPRIGDFFPFLALVLKEAGLRLTLARTQID